MTIKVKNKISIPCNHEFCLECLKPWFPKRNCPLCREKFGKYKIGDKIIFLPKKKIEIPEIQDTCSICLLPGRLLVCDNCDGSHGFYCHVLCAGYDREDTPEEDWYCIYCN